MDSLKGIAIVLIIFAHCTDITLPSFINKIFLMSKNGVQLFFVISGYLFWKSLDNFGCEAYKMTDYMKWLFKKIVRLIPIYYVALVIYIVCTDGGAYWYGNEGKVSIWNIISHFSFTNGLFPHYCNSIIGIEWYIGTLVILYVIGVLMYKKINNIESTALLLIVSIYACSFVSENLALIVKDLEDGYIYSNYFTTFGFVIEFPSFLSGILLYYIFKAPFKEHLHNVILVSYVFLFWALIMLRGIACGSNNMYVISPNVLYGFGWFLLALSQKLCECKLICNKMWACLGKYSYGIYLFHLLVNNWIKRIPIGIGNDFFVWMIRYTLVLCSSLIISVVLQKLIEKPVLNVIYGRNKSN